MSERGASLYQLYKHTNSLISGGGRIDHHTRGALPALQARVERQDLIIQTLLMILLEKKVIHEDEFQEWVIYVDELDGTRDGRLREDTTPVSCPACGRNSLRTSSRCVYCGHELEPEFLIRRPDAKG
jgi:hypothetical protein